MSTRINSRCVVALCVCMLAMAAMALFPSTLTHAATPYGITGLINIPTADVLPDGSLRLSLRLQEQGSIAGMAYGLLPGWELGAATRARGGGNAAIIPVAKVQLSPETEETFAAAIGLEDNALYFVVSRQAGAPGLRGHLGMGTGHFHGMFAGFSYLLNPVMVRPADSAFAPAVRILLEFDGRSVNAGARLGFAGGLNLLMAVRDLEEVVGGASLRVNF